jgi:hypothetical protein
MSSPDVTGSVEIVHPVRSHSHHAPVIIALAGDNHLWGYHPVVQRTPAGIVLGINIRIVLE